jgi:hypothetical protein
VDVKRDGESDRAEREREFNYAAIQAIYARWLDVATRIGFFVSLAAFLLYVSGALAPQVPLQRLAELSRLSVARFLEATGEPTGWGWLALVGRADYLNLAAVTLFAFVTFVCYLRIIPPLLRAGERLQAAIAVAQLVVLAVAASGWLTGGG